MVPAGPGGTQRAPSPRVPSGPTLGPAAQLAQPHVHLGLQLCPIPGFARFSSITDSGFDKASVWVPARAQHPRPPAPSRWLGPELLIATEASNIKLLFQNF